MILKKWYMGKAHTNLQDIYNMEEAHTNLEDIQNNILWRKHTNLQDLNSNFQNIFKADLL